jgi:response regulator RpfG family c-di-GMP phosphodiesterase
LNPQVAKQLKKTSILWIEDNHKDNSFEKNAIETLGVRLDTCKSIEEALGKVQLNQFEVIISSINFASNKQKLYVLLEKVHEQHIRSYVINYTSLHNPEDELEAFGKGVFGSTNDPLALFQLIVKAVQLVGTQTVHEFLREVRSQSHLEKILVFGYWCEIKQNQPHFTSEDILAKYREAREIFPANIGRDLRSLVSKGFLLHPGKSDDGTPTFALSNSGIKEVESRMSQV